MKPLSANQNFNNIENILTEGTEHTIYAYGMKDTA